MAQHTSASDRHEREVAQLQSEIALLNSFLKAIQILGKVHANTQEHGMGTTMQQRTPPRKRDRRYAHGSRSV